MNNAPAGEPPSPVTRLTFLGTAAAVPAAGEETASFLVNGELLVDCGWNVAQRLLAHGHDPLAVRTLLFTHCHHDHYLGLPGLLFYRGMTGRGPAKPPPLEIVGPPDDLPVVVDLARRFLQVERFPVVWPEVTLRPLEPGETYGSERYEVKTIRALHPVTGISGRLTDRRTGAVIAFSGDTAPNPALVDLARGARLLIHEASVGPDVPDGSLRGDHSRATDAARVARDAGVTALRLIHVPARHRAASVAAAKAIFPATAMAVEGMEDALVPSPGKPGEGQDEGDSL
jgi:ribonuclease Z